ncbi:class IV adenylate cyclase [Fundidesulfovibrio soli]|uniref:class IV adenylate cyclase n=1 Tax=Fundidesulfovibrio soli TaxID=2922716 RepID=UPI001FB01F7B|nr:class IV adenylate cyclase [Fundidesulfovibrio soli]
MARELEAKFTVQGFAAVRAALKGMDARFAGNRFERNVVFDTPSRELQAKGELLRLRQAGHVTLTFKKPSLEPAPAGVKAMDEIETHVEDFDAMRRILAGLGYVEALWYEKCREVWRTKDAVVCLDLLPFGTFMEIEAEPDAIARTAEALGQSMADASAVTYHDLFQQHRKELGLPPEDSFTFEEKDKKCVEAFLAEGGGIQEK